MYVCMYIQILVVCNALILYISYWHYPPYIIVEMTCLLYSIRVGRLSIYGWRRPTHSARTLESHLNSQTLVFYPTLMFLYPMIPLR